MTKLEDCASAINEFSPPYIIPKTKVEHGIDTDLFNRCTLTWETVAPSTDASECRLGRTSKEPA